MFYQRLEVGAVTIKLRFKKQTKDYVSKIVVQLIIASIIIKFNKTKTRLDKNLISQRQD